MSDFNRWLRDECNRADGSLDLAKLHALAERFGIDPTRYCHLNPGQQRMNIGNRLRSVVPPKVRLDMSDMPAVDGPLRDGRSNLLDIQSRLGAETPRELLAHHSAAIDELRRRGVVRTGNSPIGDYAEHLFKIAFGWELQPNSTAGYDATDHATGMTYQIKSRRLRDDGRGSRQLSVIHNLTDQRFDRLAILLFDAGFGVLRAVSLPHAIAAQHATYISHDNGWRLTANDVLLNHKAAIDHTDAVRAAEAQLN